MKLESANKNFLEIDPIPIAEADVVIVPFGLEKSVIYGGKGTSKGPQRIIEISPNLEFFDEELEKDVYKEVKIVTLEEPKIEESHEKAIGQLEEIIDEIYRLGKFPLTIGGEHSLTLGPVRAALKKYKRVSILQFDAHADLRDEYEGTIYNHASVMRQCLKLENVTLTQIGTRNISTDTDEFGFWQKNQWRIKTCWAKDMASWKIKDIIKSLGENVYLTFDVDAFDSSLMPSCGTPEPGGLAWYQAMEIIKAAAKERNIIGADVVELMPIEGFAAPDFAAAKLVYKIIGYKFLS
jgi:agmatinase